MSTILNKIAEFLHLKPPEQSSMAGMMEMEQQEHPSNDMAVMPGEMGMEQQEDQSNDMAAIPGEMEMTQMQSVERQAAMDKEMQTAMDTPGSMMEESKHTAGGSGMAMQDQSQDSKT